MSATVFYHYKNPLIALGDWSTFTTEIVSRPFVIKNIPFVIKVSIIVMEKTFPLKILFYVAYSIYIILG